jgi:hypothetical protein
MFNATPPAALPAGCTVPIVHEAGRRRLRKISPQPGSEPQTVRPVASRCITYAIPAHKMLSHMRTEMLRASENVS